MRTKSYVVNHTPVPWVSRKNNNYHIYSAFQENDLIFRISLEGQHDNEPLFNKAIQVDMTFYFLLPGRMKNKPRFHVCNPFLYELAQYVSFCLGKTVITDEKIIAVINASKYYDEQERTEITIREL